MRVLFSMLMLGVLGGTAIAADSYPVAINGENDSQWRIEATGKFQGWTDRRNLIVLQHPWDESEADKSATASCEVTIPQEVTGRVRLHFYMSDDYDCSLRPLEKDWLGEPDWRGEIRLVGHRFKQVLVNGEVVWESDVADKADVPAPTRFSVLLPDKYKGGDRVTLGFRLLDKVGSATRLPDDNRSIGNTEKNVVQETDPWHFLTNMWVGDIAFSAEGVETTEAGAPPSHAKVREVHAKRWPVSPASADAAFPVQLQVQGNAPNDITRDIHCGVPAPMGKVRDIKQVGLTSASGKTLAVQVKPMNSWPDGSIRWIEVDALLPAGEDGSHVMMNVSPAASDAPAVESPASAKQTAEGVILASGAMEVLVGGADGVLAPRMVNGQARIENLAGLIEIDGAQYKPVVDSVKVLTEGPIRAEAEASGMLKSAGGDLGRFVFRASVFAGQPFVKTTWRVFNDRVETPKITTFNLQGACPMDAGFTATWGRPDLSTKDGGLLRQLAANQFEVLDAAGQSVGKGDVAGGWLCLSDGKRSVCTLVRHFAEQFPKALAYKDGSLRLGLFESSESNPPYEPHEGEAKRHEMWFGLWDGGASAETIASAAKYVAESPRLFNSDYFCATGGFGMAYPHDDNRFAELTAARNKLDKSDAQFYPSTEKGIRNWGDAKYHNDTWCNGYYDRQQGYASEYLMTGNDHWFQLLEAMVLHIGDIDICHHSAEHADWLGSIHSLYAPDHSNGGNASAPWPPGQRNKGTFAYWRYSADPDARETALGIADSAIRCNRSIGATSVRDHAGVLYSLVAAYDETGDTRYRDAAAALAKDALGRLDLRRGCYAEVHANMNMRGNVPWLVAQLAEPMYDYYRQTGDVNAAIAVVGMAESIMMENCVRGVRGDVYGYSFNPHFQQKSIPTRSSYNVQIAPIFMYAFELTEDPEFLLWARAMYDETIRRETVNAVENVYWNVPTLLYYLQKFSDVAK